MSLLRPLSRPSAQVGPLCNIARGFYCRSLVLFGSLNTHEHLLYSLPQSQQKYLSVSSGCRKDYEGKACVNKNFGPSVWGNQRPAVLEVLNNLSLPSAVSFRSFRSSIHSGNVKDDETERSSRPMDSVREIFRDNGMDFSARSQFSRNKGEQNADIVHIKMLRNNTFVTITDSKGNRKPGQKVSASAGSLPDKGGKNSRYGAEAAAEHVGRKARDSGIRSVVVKVNGFTYFKKKRQAIMSFREGYTHSRGDQNPIVYIEDTTRRPHNGCRLPKKRRI